MCNILGMNKLTIGTILTMKLFKMMQLILILIIPMHADAQAKIRQGTAPSIKSFEFIQGDGTIVVGIYEFQDCFYNLVAFFGRYGAVGADAVGAEDLGCGPGG